MPVTLTIKQVPDAIADGLRRRAASNRRSMQRELLLIVERALDWTEIPVYSPDKHLAEPAHPTYNARPAQKGKPVHCAAGNSARPSVRGKLSLEQLWQRARKLGASMPDESTAIVRRDRDARNGR